MEPFVAAEQSENINFDFAFLIKNNKNSRNDHRASESE